MLARERRPYREDGAARSRAKLADSVGTAADSQALRWCAHCDRPERACETRYDATGQRCCDRCDHDEPPTAGRPPTGRYLLARIRRRA